MGLQRCECESDTMRTTAKNEHANATERLYYRAREVADLTGLGLRTIYADIYAGIIPSRKIGDARLIPASWLLAQSDAEAEQIRERFAATSRHGSSEERLRHG
jgi:excisionase family DNA binding protein